MAEIRTEQFRLRSDINTVWKLMTENDVSECRNGIAAPFLSYHKADYNIVRERQHWKKEK